MMARTELGGECSRNVGPKVDDATLLRSQIGDGCPVAVHKNGD